MERQGPGVAGGREDGRRPGAAAGGQRRVCAPRVVQHKEKAVRERERESGERDREREREKEREIER